MERVRFIANLISEFGLTPDTGGSHSEKVGEREEDIERDMWRGKEAEIGRKRKNRRYDLTWTP